METLTEFRNELDALGLIPVEVIADGLLKRCGTQDKPKSYNGWHVLYSDPLAGAFGNWRTGESKTWSGGNGGLNSETSQKIQEQVALAKAERLAAKAQKHQEAAQKAKIIESLPEATAENTYLKRKQVKPCPGIKADGETLVVPVHGPDDSIISLQRIEPDGSKKFMNDGKTKGGYFPIEGKKGPLFIAEGLATGLSIQEATGATVLVAFNANNLKAVAEIARKKNPEREIVIAGDDDKKTPGNPGKTKATEAALAVGGKVVLPQFKADEGTDFNVLQQVEGHKAVKKALEQAKETKPDTPIIALDLRDFLSLEIPPRDYVLKPIIPTQGLVLLYAPRGVGKTFLALHMAYAVATGQKVCLWESPKPRRVLYIDGEMPGAVMQERLASIVQSYNNAPDPGFLKIVTPDVQDRNFNLATAEGQAMIEPLLKGMEFVVVDNLATLARAGRENETESWHPVQDWILSLRRRGIAVLLVHHSNKSGGQRGTSSREDVLDTVISLKRPSDYSMEQGARFEVVLEKARGLIGDDAKPFEAMLTTNEGGAVVWTTRDIEDVELEMILRLQNDGCTIRDIAQETGLSKSKVHRLVRKSKGE